MCDSGYTAQTEKPLVFQRLTIELIRLWQTTGHILELPASGVSMLPLIRTGDRLTVHCTSLKALCNGDIIVYTDGIQTIVHRIGTGKFDGYAWGENIGWIHFQNASPAYYVQQDGPLVVSLASFRAKGLADRVLLEWETATEVNNAGFHIWRALAGSGSYDRITGSLIPAEGGPSWGAAYTYNDQDVKSGRTYNYKLEDIDYSGVSTFQYPASAWAGVVNIKANGSDGPVTVTAGQSVSVTVAAQTEDKAGTSMEWWIAADTPFGWYSYGQQGWISGIGRLATTPLSNVADRQVLNTILPPGDYVFYEVVNSEVNSIADPTWRDAVEVRVE